MEALCHLRYLDGRPFVSGTVQDCVDEPGPRCVTIRLDHPGCLIERCFAYGEREVLLEVGDAAAQRVLLVDFRSEVGGDRSCVLCPVEPHC